MPGRHRLRGWIKSRQTDRTTHRRATELVDAHTLTAHLLTDAAVAAGQLPKGRYVAICGQEVLPVRLTEPACGYCLFCISVPAQRSGMS